MPRGTYTNVYLLRTLLLTKFTLGYVFNLLAHKIRTSITYAISLIRFFIQIWAGNPWLSIDRHQRNLTKKIVVSELFELLRKVSFIGFACIFVEHSPIKLQMHISFRNAREMTGCKRTQTYNFHVETYWIWSLDHHHNGPRKWPVFGFSVEYFWVGLGNTEFPFRFQVNWPVTVVGIVCHNGLTRCLQFILKIDENDVCLPTFSLSYAKVWKWDRNDLVDHTYCSRRMFCNLWKFCEPNL